MADRATDERVAIKCAIHHSITQEDLERLLGVVVESLRVGENVASPENQLPKMYPEWFDLEFVRSRSVNNTTPSGFYLNPNLKKPLDDTPAYILTLTDITDLFRSLVTDTPGHPSYIDERIKNQEYANLDVLNEAQLELVNRIRRDVNGELLRADIHYLRGDARLLLSVVATLHQNAAQQPGAVEIDLTLPSQFKDLLRDELNLAVSWEWVKPLAADVDKTELNAQVVFFTFEKERRGVNVKEIRFFFNTWLKKLYEQYPDRFIAKGLALPDHQLFDATNKSPLYFDLEVWVEIDQQIIRFILQDLGPVIDDFLKAAPAGGALPGLYDKEDTKKEESKEKLTENLRKVEEVDSLIDRFEQANQSYRAETERLTAILLPQLFSLHGIPPQRDFQSLLQIDAGSLQLVEREFRLELENVLRTLTPDEFALLSARGGQLEFRVLVLRKLYGKLATNPRFVGSMAVFKEKYVGHLEQLGEKGSPDQKATLQQELNQFNRRVNLADEEFDQKLYASQTDPRQNWTREVGEALGTTQLAEFATLHNLTQADFKLLVARLASGEFDAEILIRHLDVLIAERWSPDQLRGLNDRLQIEAVLGMGLPDSLRDDPHKLSLFMTLCVEYLYARRQRLADHYQLDVISRDAGRGADLTPGSQDLTKLAEAREQATRYQEFGGAEAVIVARASDSQRVKEYSRGNHPLAPAITQIHAEHKDSRQVELQQDVATRQARFHEMSIEDKRQLLQSLGVLAPELDEVAADEDSRQRLLQQLFDEAVQQDYRDGLSSLDSLSFYEDQDRGYVEEELGGGRVTPQRYGQPGGRSLMKGALNLRKKFKTTQKRVERARKTLRAITKPLGKVEEAVGTALLGPLGKSKLARRGIFAGAIGLFIDFVNALQSGILAQVGAAGGALLGTAITIASGGTLAVSIPAFTYAGAKLGQWLSGGGASQVSNVASSVGAQLPTISPPPLPAAASTATAAQGAGGLGSAGSSSGTAASTFTIVSSGGYLAATALVTVSVVASSLQPPPLNTIGASGEQSEYVEILKQVVGPAQYGDVVPDRLNYRIIIRAKGDYEIEMVNFQDEFRVTANTELNNESPANLSCENSFTIDGMAQRTFRASDGDILMGECQVTLNQNYHDTSIFNQITAQFKVKRNGQYITNSSPDPTCGESGDTFCAISGANVCIGECPSQQEGCWPTSGSLSQGPNGSFSHSGAAAFDISGTLGTPAYATFDGTAYAFDTQDPEPANRGYTSTRSASYGKHVVIVTNNGFTLIYGHFVRFGPNLQLGQGVPVAAGDVVGYMGSTGFSTAVHLHYEYRISTGGWRSVSTANPQLLYGILPPGASELRVATRDLPGAQVTTCYDGGSGGN